MRGVDFLNFVSMKIAKSPALLRGFLYNLVSQPISRCFVCAEWIFSAQKTKSPQFSLWALFNLVSQPISRVLSWIIIRLGHKLLYGSSNLPGSNVGHAIRNPIWSCSGWSLPCNQLLPVARCALTAPFHPYQPKLAVSSLLHLS